MVDETGPHNAPVIGRNTHWQTVEDIKAGQYFKYYSRWYLAIADTIPATAQLAANRFTHAVQAYDVNGYDRWVSFDKPVLDKKRWIVVADEGKRPKPFTPAALRRKAHAHYEMAERERYAASVKETLARRLESGVVKG